MKSTRNTPWLWFAAVGMAIGVLGAALRCPRTRAAATRASDPDIQAFLEDFTRVYSLVERDYAQALDPNLAIFGLDVPASPVGAIPGMLRPLDPHSDFFSPRAFARVQEQQAVKYYGVGMGIVSQLDSSGKLATHIPSVVPGSPALNAGIRPGDIIRKVDGKSTEGLDSSLVSNMLRGPKGTVVHVSVERQGSDQLLDFTITRDEITNPTVDDAMLLKPGIGYVHINNFYETTDDELSAALKGLDRGGLKGLILDLRDNPGGILDQAVEVSDHFLAKGQLIVYQYGRAAREQRYYANHGNQGEDYALVVLVNRYTASAAEIVTGALQDHDRALVMGEPSFGKGLVQSVFVLSERAGLALTTAHYYTPSGRLIQRDYSQVSPYDYFYRSEGAAVPHGETRVTDGGRQVFGGGGIQPDIEVQRSVLNPVQQELADRDTIFEFSQSYLAVHKTIPRDFQATPDVMDDFTAYLGSHHSHITRSQIDDNQEFLKSQIRDQLVGIVYGRDQELKLEAEDDPLVAKAVESLPQAAALFTHAKQLLASRGHASNAE
jgi:carboxyl-terminal processing protease